MPAWVRSNMCANCCTSILFPLLFATLRLLCTSICFPIRAPSPTGGAGGPHLPSFSNRPGAREPMTRNSGAHCKDAKSTLGHKLFVQSTYNRLQLPRSPVLFSFATHKQAHLLERLPLRPHMAEVRHRASFFPLSGDGSAKYDFTFPLSTKRRSGFRGKGGSAGGEVKSTREPTRTLLLRHLGVCHPRRAMVLECTQLKNKTR